MKKHTIKILKEIMWAITIIILGIATIIILYALDTEEPTDCYMKDHIIGYCKEGYYTVPGHFTSDLCVRNNITMFECYDFFYKDTIKSCADSNGCNLTGEIKNG